MPITIAAITAVASLLGSIASVTGATVMAVESFNRGDAGRGLASAGNAISGAANAGYRAEKTYQGTKRMTNAVYNHQAGKMLGGISMSNLSNWKDRKILEMKYRQKMPDPKSDPYYNR